MISGGGGGALPSFAPEIFHIGIDISGSLFSGTNNNHKLNDDTFWALGLGPWFGALALGPSS